MSQKGDKKKPKSIDDIITDYQKFHHKFGKSFKERIKKFEEFHDPENIHAQQFAHHAHYAVFGKPGKEKEYPGASNEAYKKLDKHLEDDADKLEDEDKLAEILETYTDTFLQTAMGDAYKKTMEHAGKEGKLNKKELRRFKGQLMGQFYRDEKGNPLNLLEDENIKELKGKTKLDLIEELRNISEGVKKGYTSFLQQKAMEGLINEDDRLEMAKYITPVFQERGLKHKNPHITRTAQEQALHYQLLLRGANNVLIEKLDYKPLKYEKKVKEKDKK